MPELTINTKEVEVLKVNIDGKFYSIPLGDELERDELAKLNDQEEVDKFFAKYLGEELWKHLKVKDQKAIMTAWGDATKESSGVSLGE